ncbi:MAG TPA: SH3 domain-containing protein [Aggregatilineales bacterium]|nr:SH3 domain-containing protein [Aggregatilineales bacterium]
MLRRALCLTLMSSMIILAFHSVLIAHAQISAPDAIIDAAVQDLSGRVGKSLNRGNLDSWAWEEDVFHDAGLDCPAPGKTYTRTPTHGYKITLTYKGTVYDYRASKDGSTLYLCVNGVPAPSGNPSSQPTVPSGSPTAAPVGTATLLPTIPSAPAPIGYQNPMAYVGVDGNVYVTTFGTGAGTPLTTDAAPATPTPSSLFLERVRFYNALRWSPDGAKLLFTENARVFLATSGKPVTPLVTNVASGYYATWLPDSTTFAFVAQGQPTSPSNVKLQIEQMSILGGQPRIVGTITVGVGCGGGTSDASEAVYQLEAGYGGNGMLFAWTPNGWLYSTSCSGIGLALNGFDGKTIWKNDQLARAHLSPDRTRIAGVTGITGQDRQPPLVVVNAADGRLSPIATPPGVDQVAWSADGSTVFYSTLTNPQPLKMQVTNADMQGTVYTVGLYRVPAEGGISVAMFAQSGRAIGQIAITPDNQSIVFSFVPSIQDMVAAANAQKPLADIAAVRPTPVLMRLGMTADPNTKPVTQPGGSPAFGLDTFAAVSAPARSASNLSIGMHVKVIVPVGETLNLRQSPSTTAPVLRTLKPGATAVILAGPQTTPDGLQWWQVRADEDNAIGWAVDQVTGPDGTVESTLAPA